MANEIHRHALKGAQGDYLGVDVAKELSGLYLQHIAGKGKFFENRGAIFFWNQNNSKVGMLANENAKNKSAIITSKTFIQDIIEAEETLRVFSPEHEIRRKVKIFGMLSPRYIGYSQMAQLINFLKDSAAVHLFFASRNPDGMNPDILAFSQSAPSHDLYHARTPLPIEYEGPRRHPAVIDPNAVRRNGRDSKTYSLPYKIAKANQGPN